MNDYNCEKGKIIKNGVRHRILCTITNCNCLHTRYCPTKNSIEYSANAKNCKIIIESEDKQNNGKN